jgi:hypothetical protein
MQLKYDLKKNNKTKVEIASSCRSGVGGWLIRFFKVSKERERVMLLNFSHLFTIVSLFVFFLLEIVIVCS